MLYVMCGIPASGKSTYAKQLASEQNAKLYVYDDIVGKHSILKRSSIYRQMWEDIVYDLSQGETVVYDDTTLTKNQRMDILKMCSHLDCDKVIIVMNTPFNVCVHRNEHREQRVIRSALLSARNTFQRPTLDEGWNDIIDI